MKDKKILQMIVFPSCGIGLLACLVMIICGDIGHFEDSWVGFIILSIISVLFVLVIPFIAILILLPKIKKQELQQMKLDTSKCDENTTNIFDFSHDEFYKSIEFTDYDLVIHKLQNSQSIKISYEEIEFKVVVFKTILNKIGEAKVLIKFNKNIDEIQDEENTKFLFNLTNELFYQITKRGLNLIDVESAVSRTDFKLPKAQRKLVLRAKPSWIQIISIAFIILFAIYLGIKLSSPVIGSIIASSSVVGLITILLKDTLKIKDCGEYVVIQNSIVKKSEFNSFRKFSIQQPNGLQIMYEISCEYGTLSLPATAKNEQFLFATFPEMKEKLQIDDKK